MKRGLSLQAHVYLRTMKKENGRKTKEQFKRSKQQSAESRHMKWIDGRMWWVGWEVGAVAIDLTIFTKPAKLLHTFTKVKFLVFLSFIIIQIQRKKK